MKQPWIKHPLTLEGNIIKLVPPEEFHMDDLLRTIADKGYVVHL